jgi:hypothetical protein
MVSIFPGPVYSLCTQSPVTGPVLVKRAGFDPIRGCRSRREVKDVAGLLKKETG